MNNLKIFSFFFIAAIAGTLLHECGHALAAIWYGFHPTIHYAYTDILTDAEWAAVKDGLKEYNVYPQRTWVMLGGPLQTILTGMTGLTGLSLLNRRAAIDSWNTKHLFWIVLTYFHSREVFNVLMSFMQVKTSSLEGYVGDETRLFQYWDIDNTTGHVVVLVVSSLILMYATFVLVKKHRWQLILYGGLGSLIGGFTWLRWLGPLLIP